MPRYFFDLAGHENSIDKDGLELKNNDVARVQGVAFAGEYLRDHPELIWDGHEIRIHVLNEKREPMFVVVCLSIDLQRSQ